MSNAERLQFFGKNGFHRLGRGGEQWVSGHKNQAKGKKSRVGSAFLPTVKRHKSSMVGRKALPTLYEIIEF
jgi:hypothetical protein